MPKNGNIAKCFGFHPVGAGARGGVISKAMFSALGRLLSPSDAPLEMETSRRDHHIAWPVSKADTTAISMQARMPGVIFSAICYCRRVKKK